MKNLLKMGVDVGSTTVKVVVSDISNNLLFKDYRRHFSDVKSTLLDVLSTVKEKLGNIDVKTVVTGSGGIGLAKQLKLKFEQEVIASTKAIDVFNPETDVVIELGGEDAKVTFLKNGIDQRMNGICAGGTGAFIDQMASLLKTDASGLNELAKDYETIYPIASRCGVFAKTDIQPLLNDGAKKTDLAMSIFNAVVIQTVSVLSCGRKIEGKVAFLGGPLTFLSELRKRFCEVLGLSDDDIVFPEDGQIYVALGAALLAEDEEVLSLDEIISRLKNRNATEGNSVILDPLFASKEEYEEFKARHDRDSVLMKDLSEARGDLFLGLDAGSTTTKAVVLDSNGDIVYSFYGSNEGKPLEKSIEILKSIYADKRDDAVLRYATSTGYGEGLIKAALRFDYGEIETIAHFRAAKHFNKDVDFILDIGGQDMKCLEINDGVINKIILNEACSSGCGSFLETFSTSLGMEIKEFAKEGLFAEKPVDLGSRCTVFMNSRVKQAQKEGAQVGDISAGLATSVVKNALFKVIKLRDVNKLGKNIVVQGGTFYNDLVLRAFEQLTGAEVVRPNIAGIMGAFGCALISMERYERENAKLKSQGETYKTNILDKERLDSIHIETDVKRCPGCSNRCLVTINRFSEDEAFVTGNRCEVGEAIFTNKKIDKNKDVINLYDYKLKRVFGYKPLEKEDARRGDIGIVRALNMYENYPFWFRLLSDLGFRVILSEKSSKKVYERGIESIVSDTICYPAKLVHGHIESLIDKGIRRIFYPQVNYELKEHDKADNHYNCPVVSSYPEVIKNNVDSLRKNNVDFINPVISLNSKDRLSKRLFDAFKYHFDDITREEMDKAVENAYRELDKFREDIRNEGEKALERIEKENLKAVVLAGRPYHIDNEINHGIPELINSLGFAVLSEDSIVHLVQGDYDLRVLDQWVYHSRLYRAARFVSDKENIEMVQLNSFGCGLDAVTTEQVEEILAEAGKIHTVIKIDEGNNLGAVRIRLRSLKAALENKAEEKLHSEAISSFDADGEMVADIGEEIKPRYKNPKDTVAYRKNNKIEKGYTLLAPQMAPMQFEFIEEALIQSGLNVEVLKNDTTHVIEEGLRYVNNDACYPAIIVVGQFIDALKSGKYDLEKTALLITQTGGGCRASNYIGFLRRALVESGFSDIPVISLNVAGTEDNGIKKYFSLKMGLRVLMGSIYGDLLMKVLLRVRPYEKIPGSANKLYETWASRCKIALKRPTYSDFRRNIYQIVEDFDNLEIDERIVKPRVGLVGEILVKFSPLANNDLINTIEAEGAEAVVPELMNFFLTAAKNSEYKYKNLEGSFKNSVLGASFIKLVELYMGTYYKSLEKSKRFTPPWKIGKIAKKTEPVVSVGNQTGEGWLLTGEMIELIEEGVGNIICMQPFGCLPNHIIGKGTIKELKRIYPEANIIPIDYDASASFVNQLNRIKLMLSTSFSRIEEVEKDRFSILDLMNDKKIVAESR